MSQYVADPRAEELQLLRQIARQNINTTHSATYDIGKRLEANGEAMGWWDTAAQYNLEITAKGIKALKGNDDEAR